MVLNCGNAYHQLFIDQKRCDVSFLCKDDDGNWTSIGAHKFHLSAVSEVFETMFYGECVKKGFTKESDEIRIEDISLKAFRLFLKFIYSSEIKFDHGSTLAEFYSACHKYTCKDGLKFAEKSMQEMLCPQYATIFYEISVLYDIPKIKLECEKFMTYQTDEVINSYEFLSASPETINMIFAQNKVCLKSELDFCWALERYIRQNKKTDPEIAAKVRPAINSIHFLQLAASDIEEIAFLTKEEKDAIVKCLPPSRDLKKMPENFCKKKEKRFVKKRIDFIRALNKVYRDDVCVNCKNLKLSCDHPLWWCTKISSMSPIERIFYKYNHGNVCDYASDDLEKLYKSCVLQKLIKPI
ncbi:BTB/POZ domain-containing protein 3-like [Culicoides brevitarsis]|uniref:BTB/POZ domain-containing protein 3-like n=1 Tax=Culicoides brevitarsis TaxID=469753 RepID=UPI00307B8806